MGFYSNRMLFGITAIYIAFMTTSYLTQKLFSHRYPSLKLNNDGSKQAHHFKYPSLITMLGCLFCTIYGELFAKFTNERQNSIPRLEQGRLGLLFTLNFLPTNYALLYVSYPLQMIAKNLRYLCVVVVGVFFSRIQKSRQLKLPRSKIIIALFITFGAGLFMYYESIRQTKFAHIVRSKQWIGYLLLGVAVISDALFVDNQAYCKSHFKPTSNHLLTASNLFAFIIIFLVSLFSGSLLPSLSFCWRHPSVLTDILIISCLQVVGQIAIYFVVSNFKQHVYPLISTTRKIVTIVLSIFMYNHHINYQQWFSIFVIVSAMTTELYDEVESEQYHRSERLKKKEKLEGELKMLTSQERRKVDQKVSTSQVYIRNSKILKPRGQDENRNQTPAKFRYNWRVQEVVDGRVSPSPPKNNLVSPPHSSSQSARNHP